MWQIHCVSQIDFEGSSFLPREWYDAVADPYGLALLVQFDGREIRAEDLAGFIVLDARADRGRRIDAVTRRALHGRRPVAADLSVRPRASPFLRMLGENSSAALPEVPRFRLGDGR
jgi:hypothetical protein